MTRLQPALITDTLCFHPMEIGDIAAVRRHLASYTPPWRTCDFSVGGIFLWIDYFRYESDMRRDTLFIRGLNENDLSTLAFSVPVGALPLSASLAMLRRYCEAHSIQCTLSAVPETALQPISEAARVTAVEPLDDWADYLYDIHRLATLQGKSLSKKRNHVNRFVADNPGYVFEPLSDSNLAEVCEFYDRQALAPGKAVSADYERLQVLEVLRHPERFGFEGAVLSIPDHGVVAFCMGEVIGDTLYTHIEKMNHDIAGAGEAINCFYARMMSDRYGPVLQWVNREDDMGDEGLRQAKLSYHPDALLRKYNVTLE